MSFAMFKRIPIQQPELHAESSTARA